MKSPMEKIVLYAGERFRPYSFFERRGLISTVMSPNDDKFETLPDEIRRVVVEADPSRLRIVV